MPSDKTTRRRYLVTAGAAVTAAVAGCQGNSNTATTTSTTGSTTTSNATTTTSNATTTSGNNSSSGPTNDDTLPADTNPNDGFPPKFDNAPEKIQFDPSSFPTVTRTPEKGSTVKVRLVPLDVAYNLYARHEARFVDTRPQTGYDASHVFGAVRSPPPNGDSNDPTKDWKKSDTVITYCQCPTYFATERAAYLKNNGFETVYALQSGYQGWKVANYPTDGKGVPSSAKSWSLKGKTNASDAGKIAYVFHDATGQVAATKIDADGSYSIDFSFDQASGSDDATVGTPSYTVHGSLKALTSTTVSKTSGSENGTSGNGTAGNGTAGNGTFGNGTSGNGTNNSSYDRSGFFGFLRGGR